MNLGEDESAAVGFHFEHAQIRDDEIYHAETGNRQRAFFQNLWTAVFGSVLQHRDDAFHAGNEVHRAAGSFDHLAGNHPVRDVAAVGHFKRAENREIDVSAANLSERIGAREKRGARHRGDGLFAGVDEIGVFFARLGKWSDAEQSVLGLKRDVNSFRNVIGDQCRNPDAEIDIVTIAQFLGGTFRHQIANRR